MKAEIKTNTRYRRLCNNDISTHYRELEFYVLPSEFLGALAYWITVQNPNRAIINLTPPLRAFKEYIFTFFPNPLIPEKHTFKTLQKIISEETLETIPEILELNHIKPDFIDLGALARNIFYMILREHITQD